MILGGFAFASRGEGLTAAEVGPHVGSDEVVPERVGAEKTVGRHDEAGAPGGIRVELRVREELDDEADRVLRDQHEC